MSEIQGEFLQPVRNCSKASLGQDCVGTIAPGVLAVRLPGSSERAGAKRRQVKWNLRLLLAFRGVVGHEVAPHGMSGARPKSLAAAQVIAGFVAENSIPGRGQRVLNDKLPVARGETLAVAADTPAHCEGTPRAWSTPAANNRFK